MTYIGNKNFLLEVQKGNIEGTTIMKGFGERENGGTTVQGEDVWRGNELSPRGGTTIPIPPDAGDLMTITSEKGNDRLGGTGIQKLDVHYLDVLGNTQNAIFDLNGGSVNTGILMRFIQEIHATQVGSNGVSVGNVKIHKTGDTSTVYNMISKGGNQSMTTNRMVPLGSTLYLRQWDCSEAQGKRATFRIRATSKGGILNPRTFLLKDVSYLNKTAAPTMPVYSTIPALAVIKISEWNDQAGAESSASWWGLLIED